jgi:hypothetical protein
MNEVGGPFPDIPYRQPQAKPLTIPIPTGGSSRSREKNSQRVTCFTGNPGRPALKTEMARKTRQTPLDANADTRADYALIIAGIGAAVFALIYLILI